MQPVASHMLRGVLIEANKRQYGNMVDQADKPDETTQADILKNRNTPRHRTICVHYSKFIFQWAKVPHYLCAPACCMQTETTWTIHRTTTQPSCRMITETHVFRVPHNRNGLIFGSINGIPASQRWATKNKYLHQRRPTCTARPLLHFLDRSNAKGETLLHL